MFSWLIRLSGLAVSWYYTDLESSITFQSTFCPILVAVFLVSILLEIVGPRGRGSGTGGGGSDGGGFFGGDGGCGGDGGGGGD
ncbi:hypothetical protein [Shewanella surugensis]|uniref:Uncharacterized protein n=1 Tax=Shewanella surugensis TaxID=212020 RepID=A0ABT0L8W6_9GAMM|nr:hypothetical protein [Shewanella surugensis]MCL1124144.1 hypothetical protein [Shewanella surugensis]